MSLVELKRALFRKYQAARGRLFHKPIPLPHELPPALIEQLRTVERTQPPSDLTQQRL